MDGNLRCDNGNKLGYYEMTRQALIDVDDNLTALTQWHSDYPTHDIEREINSVYDSLVNALNASADCCFPRLKANALKFWWDQEMYDLKMKSVTSYRAWQAVGKSRAIPTH